jgi:hypothetical protein
MRTILLLLLIATVAFASPSYEEIAYGARTRTAAAAAAASADEKQPPSVSPEFAKFLSIAGPFFFGLLQLRYDHDTRQTLLPILVRE